MISSCTQTQDLFTKKGYQVRILALEETMGLVEAEWQMQLPESWEKVNVGLGLDYH